MILGNNTNIIMEKLQSHEIGTKELIGGGGGLSDIASYNHKSTHI